MHFVGKRAFCLRKSLYCSDHFVVVSAELSLVFIFLETIQVADLI